ncbi:MAG: hypothetical protein EVA89_11945 [Sandaracinaceae bacterium]|nr:MAG: hypothetical protein EVA89_11945 [Sandaracinaceae bacterium]
MGRLLPAPRPGGRALLLVRARLVRGRPAPPPPRPHPRADADRLIPRTPRQIRITSQGNEASRVAPGPLCSLMQASP